MNELPANKLPQSHSFFYNHFLFSPLLISEYFDCCDRSLYHNFIKCLKRAFPEDFKFHDSDRLKFTEINLLNPVCIN